jgi:EAL domain-containing protein (putative c-di-GMP-specific phosphodiesterase class I)
MSKKIIKLAVVVPALLVTLMLSFVLAFNAVRHVIIEDNEALVHSVAQSILPALLVNDSQKVDALMKALEGYPGIQSAELISSVGAPIASYVKGGQTLDPMSSSFELASAADDPNRLYVTVPITFDSVIVANLHIAVNLWPTYLRIITWLGFLLIVPSVVYVLVKTLRLKLRVEVVGKSGGSGQGGEPFDLNRAVKTAMSDADISLEYQPIRRMSDGGLFGMEVFVCWHHPSGQTLHVSPSDFLALAEKSGIFLPFDDWLLSTACTQAAAWQHQYGPLILTLNMSASQFADTTFAGKIRSACAQAQYPHQLLELEVNESVISRQPQRALACVEAFAEQGLSVTVDGFGLAQGSLDLLKVLPINKVKLDRRLVKRVGWDSQISELVVATIKHAVLHDVQVMADGIELSDQLEALQSMGCILGQGACFAPPMTAREFESFLASRPFDVSTNRVPKMSGNLDTQKSNGFSAA